MARAAFHFRTAEQREEDHENWVKRHYLEPGRRYTFEVNRHLERRSRFNGKVHRWTVYIKQAEAPWMIVACKRGFRMKFQAQKWARDYLKRGGPPEGFFDPPPPDPNEILYTGRSAS